MTTPAHFRNHPAPRMTGMTLVEVVMSVVIFTAAVAMAMSLMTSTKQYEIFSETQDEVTVSGITKVLSRIDADISSSAWYFYEQEDADADSALDAGEDANLDGALGTVDFSAVVDVDFADGSRDRLMRYYPFVTADTTNARGRAFPDIADPAGGELSDLSPWTATRFPATGSVDARAAQVVQTALTRSIVLTEDVAREMVQPTNRIIFLRTATGPWNSDPREMDANVPDDMTFFSGYSNAGGPVVAQPGARAWDWRQPDNYANLPKTTDGRETVRRLTAWDDAGGTGTWQHRNSIDAASPDFGKPYGSPAWGAALNIGGSGPRLRMQWETKAQADMYADPAPGTDYQQPPALLREYCYAVIPSPRGFGRLVRAHSAASSGTPVVGNEVGQWITDSSAATGFVIDLVLSDDVVRAEWTTRRHDAALPANVVKLRLVLARATAGPSTAGGQRQVVSRTLETLFCMRSSNEYEDQKAAADKIDIPSTSANIPFTY